MLMTTSLVGPKLLKIVKFHSNSFMKDFSIFCIFPPWLNILLVKILTALQLFYYCLWILLISPNISVTRDGADEMFLDKCDILTKELGKGSLLSSWHKLDVKLTRKTMRSKTGCLGTDIFLCFSDSEGCISWSFFPNKLLLLTNVRSSMNPHNVSQTWHLCFWVPFVAILI